MKRLLLFVLAAGLLVGAAAFSGNQKPLTGDLLIKSEERNPWTHLSLNNDPAEFQFVIVSDRTGGHRPKVFSRAVEQINLLQPEFVLSVGDLIEGYNKDKKKLALEWKEFQSYLARLQMPFFFVPGNHDVSSVVEDELWKEKFGRRYYHFVYRNVLFLLLSSEDPPGISAGHIGEDQIAYVRQALDDNRDARWTIVALHKPLWTAADVAKTGWLEVEKLLAGRPHTVFAGHIHRYRKYERNGSVYYQLATTGGSSRMRGVPYGEFDHVVWVTMRREGPVLANIMLDGIYSADMKQPETAEAGVIQLNRKPVHPVAGRVFLDGSPLPGALVTFHLVNPLNKSFSRTADAISEPDGSFTLSTYTANDGAPAGDYAVAVAWWKPITDDEAKPPPNLLPARFRNPETSELRATVKAGANEINLELKKQSAPKTPAATSGARASDR